MTEEPKRKRYHGEEGIKQMLYDERKGTVEQGWEMFEKTKDPECLAVIAERMPYFGKPEVGAKIAELLRAPYKRKPLKKGIGYEIDKKHIRKNYNMLIAEYPDKQKKWRLSVLNEWFPNYTVKAIEQIID